MLNDLLIFHFDPTKYNKNNNYTGIKIDYITQKINTLKKENLSEVETIGINDFDYPDYNYFGIKSEEFFSGTDRQSENFVLHINYASVNENSFCNLWNKYNELFHECKRECKKNSNSQKKIDLYQKIKQDRAKIYNAFRKFEAVKQKLLKNRLISIRQKKFEPLDKFEKFIRISLLIIAFPIHAVIFILLKTLMKFFHCFCMGLEIVSKFVNGCINKWENDKFDFNNCKDDWEKYCEEGYLDGIKINSKKICKRIRCWEKRWCRTFRDIFFPTNLAIFIVIGIILAVKKFFMLMIKVFVISCRIIKDIYYDDPFLYMFKKVYNNKINSEIITSFYGTISAMPDYNSDNKIKIKDKFIDCKCPRNSYYDFAEKLKSNWEVEHYDEYSHKHSDIPRLNFLPYGYVVMNR